MQIIKIWFNLILCFILFSSGGEKNDIDYRLLDSLSFYASYDNNFTADYSLGDAELYMAPTWERRNELERFTNEGAYLQIHEGEGRYGDALWIDSKHSPVFFYKGEANMPYDTENWNGTISFWLRLDPEKDLHPGYSDPIQITPHAWNNGAMFVDFTEEIPRIFRFAIFADRDIWDPEQQEWDDIPIEQRPMIEVEDLPFSSDEWTHIAMSFRNFNTGQNNGVVDCYINGVKIGSLEGRDQTFTWNPEEVKIWLGYNYRGYFDELALFDRNLSEDEISFLYSLENGISDLLND